MKKTLIALATAASLAAGVVAVPASAGTTAIVRIDYGRHHHGRDRYEPRHGIEYRIAEMEQRLQDGRRSGQLSWREADRLNDRLQSIKWTKRDYERSGWGLDQREVQVLEASLNDLSRDVRWQRRDGNRW